MPDGAKDSSLEVSERYRALRASGVSRMRARSLSSSPSVAADDLQLTLTAKATQSLGSTGWGVFTKQVKGSEWHSAHKGQKCSRWGSQHSGKDQPKAVACRTSGGRHLGACTMHKKEMTKGKENSLFSVSELTAAETNAIRELQSTKQREKLAKDGKARPDGSFPIPDLSHLKKAIRAFGRAKPGDKASVKRWIVRRARALGATEHLPESWGVKKSKKGKTNSLVAAGSGSNGTMVAAYPPPDLASKLAGGNEGDHSPEDLHVTIAYFGDNMSESDLEALRRAVFDVAHKRDQPLQAYASDPGTFDAPEGDNPRIYRITSPGLSELRDEIVKAAEGYGLEPNTEYDFNPHMTVRYGGDPIDSVPDGGDAYWPIDALVIKHKDNADVQPFGHDYLASDDEPDLCDICTQRSGAPVHVNEPLPGYLDDMQGDSGVPASDISDYDGKPPQSSFNWVEDVGGLPRAIKEVAKSIQRGGSKNESHAIAIAVSRAKHWATTSKNVKTRAKYTQAVAEWEAKKAKAHADNIAASAKVDKLLAHKYPFEISDVELIEPTGFRVSALDLEEEHMTSSVAASASAWSEDGSFYWNDETNDVYSVDENGGVSQFVGAQGEGGTDTASWEARPEMTLADVENYPTVDDPDTMESITAAVESGESPDVSKYAGAEFEIDLVIPEGIPSGDTRSFSEGALEFLEPPFPLFWQKSSGEGHNGSVTVGKFTHIERTEAGLGRARGVFDTHEDAIEAARQVDEEMLLGVSGDVDQFKAEMSTDETSGEEKIDIKHGRLVGATLVGKPAFQECRIKLSMNKPADGEQAVTAAGGPLQPPVEWFKNPELSGPTRLTVEDGGRVFGHIAAWGTSHTGNPSLQPPRSNTNYKFFRTGSVQTAEGFNIDVGHLTLAGGHAGMELSADRAIQHYDDTNSSVADVACGEDDFGIWVAGSLRPGISDEQVYAFRASAPSGDWRRLDNNLELVAVCQVNTPGFPIPKTVIASGEPMALVAAGAIAPERTEAQVSAAKTAEIESLNGRISELETFVREFKEAETRKRAEAAVASLRGK